MVGKKSTSQDEKKEIKPTPLAIIELCLTESISYKSICQSVCQKFLCNVNLVEGFKVDSKTFLSLALPN